MWKSSFVCLCLTTLFSSLVLAQTEPNWSEGYRIPDEGRPNPYLLDENEFQRSFKQGRLHTLIYPVEVTGLLLPEAPFKKLFDNETENPFRKLMNSLFKGFVRVKDYNDLFKWVGLHEFPHEGSTKEIPFPGKERPQYLMGYSPFDISGTKAFTVSCAGCHAGNLFGDRVLGMTNRFPRANHFFIRGQKVAPLYREHWFRILSGATKKEAELATASVQNLTSVGLKMPVQLGLDTSLAQVALSLNKRNPDPWAEKSSYYEKNPRPDLLDQMPADSKPAVWWNLKYKNRWLSDGSVVSGNPIHTNILWNEIGRGTDLHRLNEWLEKNQQVIRDLTTAVFATEAPRIEKYFSENLIVPERARRGEVIFNKMCSECHGAYEKAWNLPNAHELSWRDQIKTIRVDYAKRTRVENVGTDPNRALGMKSLEQLNRLAISQKIGVKIKAQKGYVPPPLVGIWARWPYLHNNSVPSLCELLTPASKRAKVYYAGEALDKKRDFDFNCNGYPSANVAPASWRKAEFRYDTRRPGMSNQGHDEGIFMQNGQELLTSEDKKDLIQFLQTL